MCAGFTPNDKTPKHEIAHGGHTRENKEKKRRPRRSACRWRPTHERRPRWAARGVTLGEPMGTRVSSHRDHDGLYGCVLPFMCGRLVRGFCIVAESECSVFSPE